MDKHEFKVKLIYYGNDTTTAFNGYKVARINGPSPVISTVIGSKEIEFRAGDLINEGDAILIGGYASLETVESPGAY